MGTYLGFGLVQLFSGPLFICSLLAGDGWVWLGFFGPMLVMLAGDTLLPAYTDSPKLRHRWVLDAFLFAQLPLTVVILLLIGWRVAPGDALGIGAFVQSISSIDVSSLRNNNSLNLAGTALAAGFVLSTNFVIAHELVHRRNRIAANAGVLLLASVADTQFRLAHLYQHHLYAGTSIDPSTARRGESLYAFIPRSSWGQLLSAWQTEKARLAAQGKSPLRLSNRMLSGQMTTLAIVVAMGWAFGWRGVLVYLASIAFSKVLYETINYIQHYGVIRLPDTPFEPRHAWDCSSSMSSYFLINLTRHSDHHARGQVEFWELHPEQLAPRHASGYITAILLAFLPPLWRRVTAPLLEQWDASLATPEERELARRLYGAAA